MTLDDLERRIHAGTTQSLPAIISGTDEATDFKFGRYINRVHPNKSPLKIFDKRDRAWAYLGTVQSSKVHPILHQERAG